MARVFSDFNVLVTAENRQNKKNLLANIQTAFKLGYEIVALNTVVEDTTNDNDDDGDDDGGVKQQSMSKKKKQRKKKDTVIPEPLAVTLDDVNEFGQINVEKCRILNRITLVMSDPIQISKMFTSAVKKYDIIAVQPTTEKVFLTICRNTDLDIIALDLNERSSFSLKGSCFTLAKNSGIAFEISYVPITRESGPRRQVLSCAQDLVQRCKGKNIVVSSGAVRAIEFRGPYDIANLALLFGLSAEQAKDSISTNCRSLLLHCESRRLARSAVSMTSIAELEQKDKWKAELLAQCKDEKEQIGSQEPKSKKMKMDVLSQENT